MKFILILWPLLILLAESKSVDFHLLPPSRESTVDCDPSGTVYLKVGSTSLCKIIPRDIWGNKTKAFTHQFQVGVPDLGTWRLLSDPHVQLDEILVEYTAPEEGRISHIQVLVDGKANVIGSPVFFMLAGNPTSGSVVTCPHRVLHTNQTMQCTVDLIGPHGKPTPGFGKNFNSLTGNGVPLFMVPTTPDKTQFSFEYTAPNTTGFDVLDITIRDTGEHIRNSPMGVEIVEQGKAGSPSPRSQFSCNVYKLSLGQSTTCYVHVLDMDGQRTRAKRSEFEISVHNSAGSVTSLVPLDENGLPHDDSDAKASRFSFTFTAPNSIFGNSAVPLSVRAHVKTLGVNCVQAVELFDSPILFSAKHRDNDGKSHKKDEKKEHRKKRGGFAEHQKMNIF